MRPYEVMVIFDTASEPPAIQAVVDRALETIRSTGGTPGAVDRWGRRPFAYEVKHKREGYYVLVDFASEVRTVAELDRFLSLADEVLRHKVIRLPEKVAKRAGSKASPSQSSRPSPSQSSRPSSSESSESSESSRPDPDAGGRNHAPDESAGAAPGPAAGAGEPAPAETAETAASAETPAAGPAAG